MQFAPMITAVASLWAASKAGGGEQQQQAQAAPEAPAQAPQTQAAKSASAATMMQQNDVAESGPGMAGSTLLTSNDLGAGTLGKSKTLGG